MPESWWVFRGAGAPHDGVRDLPAPPPWRDFGVASLDLRRAETFRISDDQAELVNAALFLRRPLLVTGQPGTGKSTLPYAVAHELRLGPVLRWPITTRSTLTEGLYAYDAVARLQDASLRRLHGEADVPDIGRYIRLGPLGTSLLPRVRPRVLLIDEIDKSDIDLPNDLLHVFEEGSYEVPELVRVADLTPEVSVLPDDGVRAEDRVVVHGGRVRCMAFPFVVLTSNGEREFPPAFLRRCVRLNMGLPDPSQLAEIVAAHLGKDVLDRAQPLIQEFLGRRDRAQVATDQLLNVIYLLSRSNGPGAGDRSPLVEAILRPLSEGDTP
jgi:MoxR-like ATPase